FGLLPDLCCLSCSVIRLFVYGADWHWLSSKSVDSVFSCRLNLWQYVLNPYPTRELEQHSGFEWAQELLAHLHAVARHSIYLSRCGTGGCFSVFLQPCDEYAL